MIIGVSLPESNIATISKKTVKKDLFTQSLYTALIAFEF